MYYIGFDKNKPKCYHLTVDADMVELADTPDLGSGAKACRFKSCYPHSHKFDTNFLKKIQTDTKMYPKCIFFVLSWVHQNKTKALKNK